MLPARRFEPCGLIPPPRLSAALGMVLVEECKQPGVAARTATELASEPFDVGAQRRDCGRA